jgi:dipeptidyl aminopeptidase/acylaminoacyl peptidase
MLKARSAILFLAAALVPLGALQAQAPAKRPLEHGVYAIWDTIGAPAISNDGAWALYSLVGYDRDGELRVRATNAATEHAIPRATGARFDAGSRAAVFLIKPARESGTPARGAGRNTAVDTLGILDLRSGNVTRIANVRSFQLPEGGASLAYLLGREANGAAGESAAGAGAGAGARAGEGAGTGAGTDGGTLVVRNLASGAEHRFEHVTAYSFTDDGRRLAYTAAAKDADASNGVHVVDVSSGTAAAVLAGPGAYRSLAWDERGEQLAFLTTRDDTADKKSVHALYAWRAGEREAKRIATTGTRGLPEGWQVSEFGAVRFSPDGRRLFFGTAPAPEPAPADSAAAAKVKVDVWHWQDPQIQPQQLVRLGQERRRNFLAVAHLRENRVVQLADESVPQVTVGARGDADIAVASSGEPYAIENNWDTPGFSDDYLVDVKTGRREQVRTKARGRVSLSPEARYLTWFDNETGWMALDVKTRKTVAMSAGIPHPLENEDHDSPSTPSAYGTAGWTPGDAELVIYDRFDLWALDPAGKKAPRNVTQGAGRRDGIRFRIVRSGGFGRFGGGQEMIDPKETLLLSAFQLRTKDAGFYRTTLGGSAQPERLIFMDRDFSTPRKAENADVVLYTRSSFEEFPDLWVAGTDFSNARKISNANPQQSEYLWGSAELVEWNSAEGIPLQGVLYKPENFDPNKKYPLVAYFYERMSDGLHTHYAPVPHRSRINFTFYTSRGYLVFVPDIVYRTGYPGESAMHAVVPGVLKLLERGYVDRDRLALQGHSWGGYQIAHMVTRTDMFRAAIAGAPVANMTSAYGGIRWESGMSRQFQYERTQSRLGQNLWDAPIRYIENSPLFWLDRVDTPLLIMHNDQDGAVPWYQGIELFMGLRRLHKPTWMVNYNGEPHWPTTAANKVDWNIRMQQFLDHYLMGAPAPVWLRDGVPAIQKGRTLGRELVAPTTAADRN